MTIPYQELMLRCKRISGFHPDTEFKSIGDIWQEVYKLGHRNRAPVAELLVGYLSEFIDSHRETKMPIDFGPITKAINAAPQVPPMATRGSDTLVQPPHGGPGEPLATGHVASPAAAAPNAPTPRTDAVDELLPRVLGGELDDMRVISETNHNYLVDHARQLERENARLVEALRAAIEQADGWCDESRGVPCSALDPERALLRELGEAE